MGKFFVVLFALFSERTGGISEDSIEISILRNLKYEILDEQDLKQAVVNEFSFTEFDDELFVFVLFNLVFNGVIDEIRSDDDPIRYTLSEKGQKLQFIDHLQ